jgi:ABC-type polysaccharide/polyol phosphate transport system ATPase subunit
MPDPIVVSSGVWKTFRLPHDRPSTFKQRVLHPRRSRAATELHALKDVSFEVLDGEFFGIIGRNGSGKSTMLKCLAGIYRPNRGSLRVTRRVSPFIELGVGFNLELTARDNVVVNAALLGIPAAEATRRFPEIIRFAELERFVDLKLKNYSSGMQVRLGFAAAIQADADVYLVDEVLAVGDARFQEKCFDTFRQFKREGRTVIYVTHDLSTVERFCDRALWLEKGELEAIGTPQEVIRAYQRRDIELAQGERRARRQTAARWGDGAAEVVEAWIEDADGRRQEVVSQGAEVTLRARIRFVDAMEDPILGVTFKDEDGRAVFSTNTRFDHVETGAFEAGDETVYSVRFAVHLADGEYDGSCAIAHQDAQRMADWREDFVSLRVQAERHTGGVVDLPHETMVGPERDAAEAPGYSGLTRSTNPSG